MGTRYQVLFGSLLLLVVLFTFVAPTLDLQVTALRAKQSAESIFLGLLLLATTLVGLIHLKALAVLDIRQGPVEVAVPRRSCAPELSCTFRC